MIKRIILLPLLAVLMALGATATSTQTINELRSQITLILSKDGFKPQMDGANIGFVDNGINSWIYIYDRPDDARVICVITAWNFDGSYTREAISNIAPAIDRMKGVKLLIQDDGFRLESDIVVTDKENLAVVLKRVIRAQREAEQRIDKMISSGLGEIDMSRPSENLYGLGLIDYVLGENQQAVTIAEYLVETGSPKGHALMARLYKEGAGVPQSSKKMAESFQKALDGGELWCAYELGTYYYDNKDFRKAFDYFTQGAEVSPSNGYPSTSLYMLGQMYENGEGTVTNLEKAKEYYRKSVKTSGVMECEARKALARLGEPAEKKEEFTEATKLMLAGLSPEDMYTRGTEYEEGINSRDISLPNAYKYFKASAEKDYYPALVKMGEIYRSPYYPFGDTQMSDKYYLKAQKELTRRSSVDPSAAYNLGMMYRYGYGVKPDLMTARDYFATAARLGDNRANLELGHIYKAEDMLVEAFGYFSKAAEADIEEALYETALAYERGSGTGRDLTEARNLYRKCADRGGEFAAKAREGLARVTRPERSKS